MVRKEINFVTIIKQEQARLKRIRLINMAIPMVIVMVTFLVGAGLVGLRLLKEKQIKGYQAELTRLRKEIIKRSSVEAKEFFYYLQVNTVLDLVQKREDLIGVIDKGLDLARNQENVEAVSLSSSKETELNGVLQVKSLVDLLRWEAMLRDNKTIEKFEESGVSESGRDDAGFYRFVLKLWWRKE